MELLLGQSTPSMPEYLKRATQVTISHSSQSFSIIDGKFSTIKLRPSVITHHMAEDYRLDVSLFERLIVHSGFPYQQLLKQHRMRPEVSRLIVPSIYAHLENHSSVYNRPHVPGVARDVFFYHHTYPEHKKGTIYLNPQEAAMALGLALYLCQNQGLPAESLTILTTYTAQKEYLISSIRTHPKWQPLSNIRVTVVDNFQVILFH